MGKLLLRPKNQKNAPFLALDSILTVQTNTNK
jgi:hypothetical protein